MGGTRNTGVSRRLALSGGLACVSLGLAPAFAAPKGLLLHPDTIVADVPEDYTGISAEKMQLSDPTYFSAANSGLVALHKRLSPHGVLRIGGNTSEFCWWKPDGRAAPKVKAYGIGRADNWMPQTFTPIKPEAVDALKGFLDACGWRCIWGFNFGTSTPERNAEEAAYVAKTLGNRVAFFQIGNEPDFYREANNLLRPAGWGFEDYLKEWMAHARAILKVAPDAKFGGPDVGGSSDWVIRFAREAKPLLKSQLIGVSGHYYASGPPDAKHVTGDFLLRRNNGVAERMAQIDAVVEPLGLGYRMTEGNSCYRGGKAGMSDAFVSAIWGGDYMLTMARYGCRGVNFHCGSGVAIASSLGGKLPGARNAADMERAKLGAFYAPIAGSLQAGFDARPLYYGMMLAQNFAGTQMMDLSADFGGVNASAFAALAGKELRLAIFNKDPHRALSLPVNTGRKVTGSARILQLTGPAPDAISGVRLAGDVVAHQSAAWAVRKQDSVPFKKGRGMINILPFRAILAILPV